MPTEINGAGTSRVAAQRVEQFYLGLPKYHLRQRNCAAAAEGAIEVRATAV